MGVVFLLLLHSSLYYPELTSLRYPRSSSTDSKFICELSVYDCFWTLLKIFKCILRIEFAYDIEHDNDNDIKIMLI